MMPRMSYRDFPHCSELSSNNKRIPQNGHTSDTCFIRIYGYNQMEVRDEES
jgi:hypothetical protein